MVWVSDITYIRVGNKWNYLTTIIDLADRKIVAVWNGWSLSSDMTAENTVLRAWSMARQRRDIKDEFIFHSDRGHLEGVQYACNQTKNIFSFHRQLIQSMSRKGDCWDNAVAESLFKTIKYESLNRQKFDTTEQLYKHLFEYIEEWYNVKRIHSSLGYMTPLENGNSTEIQFKKSGLSKCVPNLVAIPPKGTAQNLDKINRFNYDSSVLK